MAMRLTINGQDRQVEQVATIADLVTVLELDPKRIAIERNRQLVRRGDYAAAAVADGDAIEIVTLVGGG